MKLSEILQSFHAMPTCDRMDLVCRMLRYCVPYELRFLGTIILDAAQEQQKSFRHAEVNANRVNHYSGFNGLNHEVCEKLCCALAVLHADNRPVAEAIYSLLNDPKVLTYFEEATDLKVLEDFRLLYVMASNHPALSFNQRQQLMYLYLQRMDTVFIDKCKYTFSGSFSNSVEKTLSGEVSGDSSRYPPEGHFNEPAPDAYITRCNVYSVYKRAPDKRYVYMAQVEWSDGTQYIARRTYGDFFSFQTKLLDMFPEEGGQKGKKHPRLIPYLPGKNYSKFLKNRDVAEKRLPELARYTKELISLPEHISRHTHVLEFFKARPSDQKEGYPPHHKITTLYDLLESGPGKRRVNSEPLKGSPTHSPALIHSSPLQRATSGSSTSSAVTGGESPRLAHTLPTATTQQTGGDDTPAIPRRPTYPLTNKLKKSEKSAFTTVAGSSMSEDDIVSASTSQMSIPAGSSQLSLSSLSTPPSQGGGMATPPSSTTSSSTSPFPFSSPAAATAAAVAAPPSSSSSSSSSSTATGVQASSVGGTTLPIASSLASHVPSFVSGSRNVTTGAASLVETVSSSSQSISVSSCQAASNASESTLTSNSVSSNMPDSHATTAKGSAMSANIAPHPAHSSAVNTLMSVTTAHSCNRPHLNTHQQQQQPVMVPAASSSTSGGGAPPSSVGAASIVLVGKPSDIPITGHLPIAPTFIYQPIPSSHSSSSPSQRTKTTPPPPQPSSTSSKAPPPASSSTSSTSFSAPQTSPTSSTSITSPHLNSSLITPSHPSPSPPNSGTSTPRGMTYSPSISQLMYGTGPPPYSPVFQPYIGYGGSPLPSPLPSPKTNKWHGSYTAVNRAPTEYESLVRWLKSHRLHKYYQLFESITFDEMCAMTTEQLEAKGMTQGAAKKLWRKLEELKRTSFAGFRDMPLSVGMARKPSTCSLPAALLMERGMTPSSSFDGSFISPSGSTCSLDILAQSSGGGGGGGPATTRTLTPSQAHRCPPSTSSHPHNPGDSSGGGGSRRHSKSESMLPLAEGSPVITSMDTAIVKAVPVAKAGTESSPTVSGGDSSINTESSVNTSDSPSYLRNKSSSSSNSKPKVSSSSTSSMSPDGSRLSHASSGRGSRQSDGNSSWADHAVTSDEAASISKPEWAQMPGINGEIKPSPHPSSSSHTHHSSASPSSSSSSPSHPHTTSHTPPSSHHPHSRQQLTPVPSKRHAIHPDTSSTTSTPQVPPHPSSAAHYRDHNPSSSSSSVITVPQPVLGTRNTSSAANLVAAAAATGSNWTQNIVQQHQNSAAKVLRTANSQSGNYVPCVAVMNGIMPVPPPQLNAQRVPPPHHPHPSFVMAAAGGGLVTSPPHHNQAAAISSVRGGGGGNRAGATSCFNCGKGGHLGHTCPGDPMETVSFHRQMEQLSDAKSKSPLTSRKQH